MQAAAADGVLVDIVGVSHNGRELGDELYRLSHEVVATDVVGVRVKGVHLQDAARKDVHDVGAFDVDDVHDRTVVQCHVVVEQFLEGVQFLLVGQLAGEQEVSNLLKAEPLLLQQW